MEILTIKKEDEEIKVNVSCFDLVVLILTVDFTVKLIGGLRSK